MPRVYENLFKPCLFLKNRHLQTIIASFLLFSRFPSSLTRFIHLPDGDQLVYEVITPKKWTQNDLTVVMIHGLCGSCSSPYLIRLAKKFRKRNIRTICVNLRGCGKGRGLAKRIYHVDISDDIWRVLKEIQKDTPQSPLFLVGFSLGGNIALKMVGERGAEAKSLVSKIIAVNPPIDLYSSVQLLSKNRFYERYFMRYLRSDVFFRHHHFADLPPLEIPTDMTLVEFDEFYMAPQSGFLALQEYYQACSSGRLIPEIQIPCHILFAKDDPIVDTNILSVLKIPENVEVIITDNGGHLGYLGSFGKEGGGYWMDFKILNWICSHQSHRYFKEKSKLKCLIASIKEVLRAILF